MLEYILMTQLYFTDGTYEFRNYDMKAPSNITMSELCNDTLKENALFISFLASGREETEIFQQKAICTDIKKVLDFYPIPQWVPRPERRPA